VINIKAEALELKVTKSHTSGVASAFPELRGAADVARLVHVFAKDKHRRKLLHV